MEEPRRRISALKASSDGAGVSRPLARLTLSVCFCGIVARIVTVAASRAMVGCVTGRVRADTFQ